MGLQSHLLVTRSLHDKTIYDANLSYIYVKVYTCVYIKLNPRGNYFTCVLTLLYLFLVCFLYIYCFTASNSTYPAGPGQNYWNSFVTGLSLMVGANYFSCQPNCLFCFWSVELPKRFQISLVGYYGAEDGGYLQKDTHDGTVGIPASLFIFILFLLVLSVHITSFFFFFS